MRRNFACLKLTFNVYFGELDIKGLMKMASPARKRKELKLTVEQVASGVGCSAPNYWRIESGDQPP